MRKRMDSHAKPLFRKTIPFDAATAEIPRELQTAAFLKAWFEWCDYRSSFRCKVTKRACEMQLEELAQYGPEVAIAAIRHSIANDYQGLFPRRVSGMIAGKVRAPQFSGLRQWAEQNKETLHREYGT